MLEDRGTVLTGLGLGAGLMYFLDPERGRRRRALVRDQATHAARIAGDAAGATGRDLAHRASGITATTRRRFTREPVDDDVLAERVRARLGRVVSHPHAVKVRASDGIVTLHGPILRHEVRRLLRQVGKVRGVREVINELDEHREPGNVPALQGGSTPPGLLPDVLQRNWSPTTRVLAGGGGMALAAYGASRRTMPGALAAAAGVGLLARAASNMDVRRLSGIGGRRRAADVQKTLTTSEIPEPSLR